MGSQASNLGSRIQRPPSCQLDDFPTLIDARRCARFVVFPTRFELVFSP
jgi:hypothetical protein